MTELRDALADQAISTNKNSDKNTDKVVSKLDEINEKKEESKAVYQKDKKTSQKAILSQIKAVEEAVKSQEVAETVSIKNPEAITGDLKAGLEGIINTLKKEVRNFDKQVTVKNDLGQLATLFKGSQDKKAVIDALKKIESKLDKEETDYTLILSDIADALEAFNNDDVVSVLKEILAKDYNITLPGMMDVNLDPNLIENDRVRTVLPDDQVSKMSKAFQEGRNGGATSDNQTNGDQKTVIQTRGEDVGVQNPLQVDGDSVYSKDVWVEESVTTDWEDTDSSGDSIAFIPFENLHTRITNNTSDAIKTLLIHFHRTIDANQVGLGCTGGGDFSNVKVTLIGSGSFERLVKDESSDNTKYTSKNYKFRAPELFNAIKFEFFTTDEVCLSNITIQKATRTTSQIESRSELTEEIEPIKSFRGALNITESLVHRLGVNEYFVREVGTATTLASAASAGDITISVADSTGFVVGDKIQINENGTREIGVIFITAVVGNDITIDRPLANDFPIGTNITEVENNMTSTAGTLATPVTYILQPPAGQIWQITRVLVSMTDTGSMDDDKFGSLPALTNGVVGRAETAGSRIVNFTNWKKGSDLVNDMYDVNYPTKTPGGNYALRGRWTFLKGRFIIELDGDEGHCIKIIIQDDLTDMDSFKIKAQGRIFNV